MRDMTEWLGDGGMPLLTQFGLSFQPPERGDDRSVHSVAVWQPTPITANPAGIVQGGAHTVVLDAAIGFAVNANLDPPDRLQATWRSSRIFCVPHQSACRWLSAARWRAWHA